jgi:hypothetical protein
MFLAALQRLPQAGLKIVSPEKNRRGLVVNAFAQEKTRAPRLPQMGNTSRQESLFKSAPEATASSEVPSEISLVIRDGHAHAALMRASRAWNSRKRTISC